MSSLRPEEVEQIQAIANLAPAIIDPVFGANACIPTTRIVVAALNSLGTQSRAMSVETHVINAQYLAAVEQLGRPFRDLAEATEWHRTKGVFSYGIGAKDAPGRWPGHLVVIVRQRALLDLTIAQADNPEYGMVLAPMFGNVSGRFLNGHDPAMFRNNGCQVTYEGRPRDRSYEETPNWRDRDCVALARELERLVREVTA